jgi:hypothetical protein
MQMREIVTETGNAQPMRAWYEVFESNHGACHAARRAFAAQIQASQAANP